MARKQEYGNESITSLKGADRVRKRPAVIFGSDGVEGCAHSIFEIVSNSIDEARDGHGDTINVTRCKDGSVIVEDFGRGMPVDWNNGEGRYNWELLFCEMYAGGKYGEGEDNYEFSLGLNGLGLCATQYASAWMTADIYRDGYHYHLDFKKGENVGGLQKEAYKGRRTGSIIHWKPDDEVFTDIDVPGSYYKDVLRRQAVVNAGLTLNFTDEKEKDPATGKPWKESWCYEHGIADYVAETAGEDSLTPVFSCESEATGRDRDDQPEYKVKMSAAFCFSNKVQMLEYYHNSSWLEHGGSPEHAVRTAFVYQINKYLKDKNLYKKGESAISFQDVQDCLVYVSSSFSTRTSYENQTKKAITNKFVSQAMTDFLKHYLEVYFLEKPDEAQKICQQVLVNKQSREHAEKTRQSIKKTLTTQIDLANRVQKFVDCRTKDASRRELYIVEGDSAMGAVKTSRDSEYQAIMPIRGKILNCLKADYARIFKSDVIVDLIKVMGCGVELGGKHNKELATFNLDNLRFNKIVICTDADVDGYQIRTLVLTMLYRLTPTLINEGYVYIAESPLYEITTKDRTYFAYTEPEKATFLEEIGDKKYTIQRSKGLGENDPEMMWLTTMNPESRRLIKVMPTDVERTAQVFDILLGDNLAGRKEHIAQHGAEYLDDLDVSQGETLTRQDCVTLFYNLLVSENSEGTVYGTTLGYTVTNGEVDYSTLVTADTKGPYVADSGSLSLPFSTSGITVYRNGTASELSAVQQYDVYYYNENLRTVWIYSDRVTGTLTAVSPGTTAPTSVTVAGGTYELGTSTAVYQFSSQGDFSAGDTVTLLLGMNGEVVQAVSAAEADTTYYGVVLSSTKGAADGSTTIAKGADSYTVTPESYDCVTASGEVIELTHYCYVKDGITYIPMDFAETL